MRARRASSARRRPAPRLHAATHGSRPGSGSISAVFHGRREIAGITVGTILRVNGTAVDHHGRLALLNPLYTLVATPNGQAAFLFLLTSAVAP